MHYLACNHCEHLNEIKSEHLILCEKCGKEMSNTFAEWKKHRAHGTYEAYLNEWCANGSFAEKGKQPHNNENTKRRRFVLMALALGVMAALGIGIAVFMYGEAIKTTIQDTLGIGGGLKWTEQCVGTEGLVVNFPKKFENANELVNQIPKSVISQFEKSEASIAGFNKGFIAIAFTMVKSQPDTGNLSHYAELGLEWLAGSRTLDESSFELKNFTLNNNPAILQQGVFTSKKGKRSRFSLLLAGKERNFWIVMIVAPENDTKAQRIARKFIRSVKIKPGEDS